MVQFHTDFHTVIILCVYLKIFKQAKMFCVIILSRSMHV